MKAGSVTPMTQLHFGHLCVNFLKSITYSFKVSLSFFKGNIYFDTCLKPLRQQARHPTIQEKKQLHSKHQIHPKSLIESSTTVVTFMLHVLQWIVAGVTPRSASWRWTTTMVWFGGTWKKRVKVCFLFDNFEGF